MSIYIQSSAAISPQKTYVDIPTFEEIQTPIAYSEEPIYKEYFDLRVIRRMSRIIKMGVTTSKICLEKSAIDTIDAIIVGTGLGCITDSDRFLLQLIEDEQQLLNPTPFIQSTHNTVAGQIGLLLKNTNYNFTYSQSGFSFENALFDAKMILEESPSKQILVGGSEEFTENLETIYEQLPCSQNRTVPFGEGTSFFVLGTDKSENSLAELVNLEMIYKPSEDELQEKISDFLDRNHVKKEQIDLVLLGDAFEKKSSSEAYFLENYPCISFKKFCGEYHTASAFALWLSSFIFTNPQKVKEFFQKEISTELEYVLVYNTFKECEHSLILLKKC